MLKKKLYQLIGWVALFAILIVLTLYGLSYHAVQSKNGFVRLFLNAPILKPLHQVDLKYNSWYIAGQTSSSVFLGNYVQPERLFLMDLSGGVGQQLLLNFRTKKRIAWKAIKITIDSPFVYALEGVSPLALSGTLPVLNVELSSRLKYRFNQGLVVSNHALVLRAFDQEAGQNVLRRFSNIEPGAVTYLLEQQNEGVFSTDGMLIFNRKLSRLIYVYYYRNRFTVLDTLLNKVLAGRTIDTISMADIRTAEIKSEHALKLLNQPVLVNKHACTFADKLYLHAGLRADNELLPDFDHNAVIDVYDLLTAKYLHSFYLPNLDGKMISDFSVWEDKIVALYDHQLMVFSLPSQQRH